MNSTSAFAADPAPQAEWSVWYQDTFDRETPLSREAHGRGLALGLMELWARFLFETVRPDGGHGFSRFHLRWDDRFVHIEGDWAGAVRLRRWVFGEKEYTQSGYLAAAGDPQLLKQIASVHARLVLADKSSALILDAAVNAKDRRTFFGMA